MALTIDFFVQFADFFLAHIFNLFYFLNVNSGVFDIQGSYSQTKVDHFSNTNDHNHT